MSLYENMISLLFIFLVGVVCGVGLIAGGVYYVATFFFHDPDKKNFAKVIHPKIKEPTSATFQLPPVLITKINEDSCKSKESCWALNFVLYFLFRELRNSEVIRRWMLRKLSLEFEELLTTSVLGKLFSSISIQNIDLGQNFPVLNWLKTSKVELHPVFKNISTLDILVDLDYSGGFQFAIQAETHLKHSAFLSVQFNEVKGQARLQFATEPYPHWSFSFVDNPDIDISVVSQLYGKSFSHITSIISSQLKRSVRKKHTLPMYKIRYKPFFNRVENIIAALVPNSAPIADVKGALTVTVIECRGLMSSLLHGNVYINLAIGDFDWVAAYTDIAGTVFIIRDVVYIKTARREANLDFTLGMTKDCPVIESLNSPTSSSTTTTTSSSSTSTSNKQPLDFEIGDEILFVDGKKVTSIKQCVKNFKNSSSMKVIWRIGRKYLKPSSNVATSSIISGQVSNIASTSTAVSNAEGKDIVSNEAIQLPNFEEKTIGISSETTTKKEQLYLSTLTGSTEKESKSNTPSESRRNSFAQEIAAQAEAAFSLSESASSLNELNSNRSMSYFFKQSPGRSNECHVVRTPDTPCSRDPIFTESFDLRIEESNRFLNLSVWSAKAGSSGTLRSDGANGGNGAASASSSPTSSPSKRSKTLANALESLTFGGDRLIGTLSIPILDVIADCSTTGMGYFVKDYYLKSPDGNAVEAKEHFLMGHSGFEPHMCYGKVSLSFLFRCDERKTSMDSAVFATPSPPPIEIAAEALSDQEMNSNPTEEFQTHDFVRTHFRTATACDYCNKKIWLKEAFACRICNMKCHKKCNERCMANTVCRGDGFYPSVANIIRGSPIATTPLQFNPSGTPEIITTDSSDPNEVIGHEEHFTFPTNDTPTMTPTNTVYGLHPNTNNNVPTTQRRKTLGGLIVSAVQNRSAQLRRAGSATNLAPPNQSPNSSSKSLPPSPKASPTTTRKLSTGAGSSSSEMSEMNPFETLALSSSGGLECSDDDLNAAVNHLIQHPNDNLVALAKETGRDAYSDLSLSERKHKLNDVLNRLQEEIDIVSAKRLELCKQENALSQCNVRAGISSQITKCEEKVQALALLMLHFCSGLQNVQDLEEIEKESEQLLIFQSSPEESGGLIEGEGSATPTPIGTPTDEEDLDFI